MSVIKLLHHLEYGQGAPHGIYTLGNLELDLFPFLDQCHWCHIVFATTVRNPLVWNEHLSMFRIESLHSCLFCSEVPVINVKVKRGLGFKLNTVHVIEVHITIIMSVVLMSWSSCLVDECELPHPSPKLQVIIVFLKFSTVQIFSLTCFTHLL